MSVKRKVTMRGTNLRLTYVPSCATMRVMEYQHPVRHFRLALSMSQDALADKIGESKSKISRVENGHQDVDLDFLRKIAALAWDPAQRERLIRDVVALPSACAQLPDQSSEQEAAA